MNRLVFPPTVYTSSSDESPLIGPTSTLSTPNRPTQRREESKKSTATVLPSPGRSVPTPRRHVDRQGEINYLKSQVQLAEQLIKGIEELREEMYRTHQWDNRRYLKYKKDFHTIKLLLDVAFTYGDVAHYTELTEDKITYERLVKKYRELETKPALPGVKYIAAHGHCLFLSIATWAYPDRNAHDLALLANELRVQCVDYITEQYKVNQELREHLVSSLMDFFESEGRYYEDGIWQEHLNTIMKIGIRFFEREDIDHIMGIYLESMRQTEENGLQGITFGSSAEIYAASQLLHVTIQVYYLQENNQGVQSIAASSTVFRSNYIREGQPVFSLCKTSAHYDVFEPPSK
jgi:hypothetical protein